MLHKHGLGGPFGSHGMHGPGKCYGSTVVGERGQVVIPADARDELGIQAGEKLVVFGNPRRGMVILLKGDIMARFTEVLLSKFSFVEKMFKEFTPGDLETFEDQAPSEERKD